MEQEINEKSNIKENKASVKSDIVKQLNKQVITAITPIILSLMLNYGICNIYIFPPHTPAICLSFFMMYAIFCIITAIVKKTNITTYIISVLIFVISIISNVKLYYSQSPVYLSDIYFLNNFGDVAGLVKNDLFSHINYIQMTILLLILVIICVISKKTTIEIKNMKVRIISGIALTLLFIGIVIPIESKDSFLLDKIYNVNGRKDYGAAITGLDYYSQYGVLAGILGMELEGRRNPPEDYDRVEVANILESEGNSINAEEKYLQKPNIIVMFQESYWNIENLQEVKFDKNVTENMNKLKDIGSSVKLLSPSYGGLSSNIEFELLTGGNLSYFGSGYHPFVQLYSKNETQNNPSIIKELRNNGYKTTILFGRDYYSSESVYKKLGADEYINAYTDKPEYQEKIKGDYISDEALVDYVLEALYTKPKDDKVFYMAATIQTHMPFYKEKYENYDINIVESSLSQEENDIILSYAQGVYDTNIQIQRLYYEIQKLDDPTIVIVLGDHLPYLYNSDGEDILLKSSYFNTGDEKQDVLRQYTTEAVILSNYDKKVEFESEYISPDMLLTTIINNMNIDISSFYKWLYKIRDVLPAQSQYLNVTKQNDIYYKNEVLPEDMQKTVNIRSAIQYYLFEDFKRNN